MHKNATKCNETLGKWCKNKHGASKIIDTFETYQMYVNNINSFLLLSSIVLSFIQLIYIHIDLLKVVSDAEEAPTNPAHTSNSRGAGRISAQGGHR
jgi:hypothetical protein